MWYVIIIQYNIINNNSLQLGANLEIHTWTIRQIFNRRNKHQEEAQGSWQQSSLLSVFYCTNRTQVKNGYVYLTSEISLEYTVHSPLLLSDIVDVDHWVWHDNFTCIKGPRWRPINNGHLWSHRKIGNQYNRGCWHYYFDYFCQKIDNNFVNLNVQVEAHWCGVHEKTRQVC